MDFSTDLFGIAARVLAVISLIMGLGDAAQLLGVGSGAQSPLIAFGTTGFWLLAVLSAARLFSALGLWLGVQWGGVLLAVALFVELTVYLFGETAVAMSLYSFIFKLVVMLATIALIATSWFLSRRHALD